MQVHHLPPMSWLLRDWPMGSPYIRRVQARPQSAGWAPGRNAMRERGAPGAPSRRWACLIMWRSGR